MDLPRVVELAIAGTATLNVDKPEAGKLIIRAISLWSLKALSYVHIYGYLFEKGKIDDRKALLNKIIPQSLRLRPMRIWEGLEDWPDNWRLSILLNTQTAAEELYYLVSYEKVAPKKLGWPGW